MSLPARIRWWPWLAAMVYAVVIFALSSEANPLPALTAHVWDKLLHLVEYGGLGFLVGLAAGQRSDFTSRDVLFWASLVGLLYGASDELHQSFVPGRDAEVGDVLADGLGSVIGGTFAASLRFLQARLGRS